jgi:hypothetical protein
MAFSNLGDLVVSLDFASLAVIVGIFMLSLHRTFYVLRGGWIGFCGDSKLLVFGYDYFVLLFGGCGGVESLAKDRLTVLPKRV